MNNKEKNSKLLPLFIAAILLLSFNFIFTAVPEFSMEKALLIDASLKRIAQNKRPGVFLRKLIFSEIEMNSYLNLVYTKRYTPEVKYIKLKLQKNNFINGLFKVKLEGKKYGKVPSFLRDIEVEVAGKMECRNYRMRFIFNLLKVNGTSFSPEVIDEAFGAAQVNYKTKKSLFDWFHLLPGIKSLQVDEKKITIFY